MSSKAQLEINETIMVLIIFTLLVILAIVIFHRYNKTSIDSTILENQRLSFYELLNQIPNMPELKCSSQSIEEDCMDLLKMLALSKYQSSYSARFGYKSINIRLIYPSLPNIECSESLFQEVSFPNCNNIVLYERLPRSFKASEKISSPVAVYNPLTNQYLLGLLEITWYY